MKTIYDLSKKISKVGTYLILHNILGTPDCWDWVEDKKRCAWRLIGEMGEEIARYDEMTDTLSINGTNAHAEFQGNTNCFTEAVKFTMKWLCNEGRKFSKKFQLTNYTLWEAAGTVDLVEPSGLEKCTWYTRDNISWIEAEDGEVLASYVVGDNGTFYVGEEIFQYEEDWETTEEEFRSVIEDFIAAAA